MRSIRLMAATTVMLTGIWSCGDNGGTEPPPNRAPTAAFTSSCTGLVCSFANTSSDPDEGTTLTYSWTFGEANSPTNTSTETNPSHTYAAAGTYTVSLTANDGDGGTHSTTSQVTVTAANAAPTANFDPPACVVNVDCTFISTSTDTDGTIANASWTFSDGSPTLQGLSVVKRFTAAGRFQVGLTVTDDDGATASVTKDVTVSPPASQACVSDPSNSEWVNCTVDITANASLTVTMTSNDCELGGNQFQVRFPTEARQFLFFNGCSEVEGTQYVVDDASGAPIVFAAGTQVVFQFRQGDADPTDPPVGTPAARLEGTFPTWTLRIDDGGNPTGPGEPDFGDIVLTIQAN
jgi:PKD repeat protein